MGQQLADQLEQLHSCEVATNASVNSLLSEDSSKLYRHQENRHKDMVVVIDTQ
jgi:glucan phosphoethanolaminetransferase (alkaline phosphatase superfamily)